MSDVGYIETISIRNCQALGFCTSVDFDVGDWGNSILEYVFEYSLLFIDSLLEAFLDAFFHFLSDCVFKAAVPEICSPFCDISEKASSQLIILDFFHVDFGFEFIDPVELCQFIIFLPLVAACDFDSSFSLLVKLFWQSLFDFRLHLQSKGVCNSKVDFDSESGLFGHFVLILIIRIRMNRI